MSPTGAYVLLDIQGGGVVAGGVVAGGVVAGGVVGGGVVAGGVVAGGVVGGGVVGGGVVGGGVVHGVVLVLDPLTKLYSLPFLYTTPLKGLSAAMVVYKISPHRYRLNPPISDILSSQLL